MNTWLLSDMMYLTLWLLNTLQSTNLDSHVNCSYFKNPVVFSVTTWWQTLWPFQPELNNEVFDDDIDGKERADKGLTSKVSPRSSLTSDRREYMSLAAVPRLSRLSADLQVSTATARAAPLLHLGSGLLGLMGGGVCLAADYGCQ